jgi:hypothetical protein
VSQRYRALFNLIANLFNITSDISWLIHNHPNLPQSSEVFSFSCSRSFLNSSLSHPRPPADEKGPSKNELKKLAKAAEKEKQRAEKAAKQAELAKQKEAAEVVSDQQYF